MKVLSHAMWITPGEGAQHHDHCPCVGTPDEWLTEAKS